MSKYLGDFLQPTNTTGTSLNKVSNPTVDNSEKAKSMFFRSCSRDSFIEDWTLTWILFSLKVFPEAKILLSFESVCLGQG